MLWQRKENNVEFKNSSEHKDEGKKHRAIVLSVVKHDYLPRAAAVHPKFQLVGVADHAHCPNWVHERNQAFADEFDIPYLRNVRQALQSWDANAAIISSEAERHCELGLLAAEAGLHLLMDKPLSPTLSECDQLAEAVRRRNLRSLVWNRNHLTALIQAKTELEAGKIGRLTAIHCDFYFAKDAGPRKGSRRPEEPPIPWLKRQLEAHADGSDGGLGVQPIGELQIEGIYPLAYINMLTGRRIERVFARTATRFHQAHADNQVEDLATVTLEMSGGIIGSLCIGRIGHASHPDIGEIKLHLLGTQGAFVVAEARPEISVYRRNQPPSEFKHRRVANRNDFLLMEEFARAIEKNEPTTLDVLKARNIAAVVQSALESARTGRLVPVDNKEA